MRKTLQPFAVPQTKKATSVGGSKPIVQATSEALAASGAPTLAARIYSAPALKMYDDSDPRYDGKANNVDNIYHPAEDAAPRRSGIAQVFNWLLTGRMQ